MKCTIVLYLFFCTGIGPAFAFSDSTVTLKDFKNLSGCWKGNLTYLDYTSGKPFSMPANLMVTNSKKSNRIIYALLYPREPNANSFDTLIISKNGKYLNGEIIKTKRTFTGDSLEIVTETTGIDGNDNKAALIRHTYNLSRNSYTIKKEVQFIGQTIWILRNEYQFMRIKPCS